MAKNTDSSNKRYATKWIRDKAKAAYVKQETCAICGTKEDLELHHLASVTVLLNKWADAKGYDISTDEGVLEVRDEFIEQHHTELYDDVYTLCNKHHVRLHGVYGKAPPLNSAQKQRRWISKMRERHELGPSAEKTGLSVSTGVPTLFSSFYNTSGSPFAAFY